MTKKETIKWLLEAGYSSEYSGKTKTLFVNNIMQKKLDYFNLSCSFSLKANENESS